MLPGRSEQDVGLVLTALRGSGRCWQRGDTAGTPPGPSGEPHPGPALNISSEVSLPARDFCTIWGSVLPFDIFFFYQ